MSLLTRLAALWYARELRLVVEEVVQRTRDRSWRLVEARVVGMGQAEALGYSRARTAGLLEATTRELLRNHPRLESWAFTIICEISRDRTASHMWQLALSAKQSLAVRPRLLLRGPHVGQFQRQDQRQDQASLAE